MRPVLYNNPFKPANINPLPIDKDTKDFVGNIDSKVRNLGLEKLKTQMSEDIKDLKCKKCGEKRYNIISFSQSHENVIGHLKCENCEFEEEYCVIFKLDENYKKELEESMNSFKKSLKDIKI